MRLMKIHLRLTINPQFTSMCENDFSIFTIFNTTIGFLKIEKIKLLFKDWSSFNRRVMPCMCALLNYVTVLFLSPGDLSFCIFVWINAITKYWNILLINVDWIQHYVSCCHRNRKEKRMRGKTEFLFF